jgi:hypothetical protein
LGRRGWHGEAFEQGASSRPRQNTGVGATSKGITGKSVRAQVEALARQEFDGEDLVQHAAVLRGIEAEGSTGDDDEVDDDGLEAAVERMLDEMDMAEEVDVGMPAQDVERRAGSAEGRADPPAAVELPRPHIGDEQPDGEPGPLVEAPVAEPPPAGEHGGDGRRQPAAGQPRHQRMHWDRLYYEDTESYVRLSQTRGSDYFDMRAVCGIHGCTLSRRCKADDRNPAKGRPLGLLWSFLGLASNYATKDDHVNDIAVWGAFANRSEARRLVTRVPRATEWLTKERPLKGAEGPEPAGCP